VCDLLVGVESREEFVEIVAAEFRFANSKAGAGRQFGLAHLRAQAENGSPAGPTGVATGSQKRVF
jgi:hypothetical protein